MPNFHSSSSFLLSSFMVAILISCISHSALASNHGAIIADSPMLTSKLGINRTIKVDMNGQGDFTRVQDAIDSIPEENSQWVIVHVRKGLYREKVRIHNKPYIFLRGNGRGRTSITSSQSSTDNVASATFRVEAHDVIVFGISFQNEAPTGVAYTSQNQSVAVYVAADKVAFYHCSFYSTHNTLFDQRGRHYYANCYIQGSIDFIFGRARTIFYNPEIFVIDDKRLKIRGSITAHNRENADELNGYIFIKGKVYGIGSVYLGRAKGSYSRVIFAETYLSKTIVAAGWTNWSHDGSTENMVHAEYNTRGPGAVKDGRAPWSLQLTKQEVEPFLSIDYIDGKNWLPVWL
ncbi:probable pectinesterase 67 [Vigna radiata var. radiata]|uniref:Pectinesterase n=1 Tax=Vigna radiata var. radiata TaxID=3916 RepID=A0A1S3VGI2_VIGRR|nr:probable pectinesterase 67 [Vigna radiata var. radiata]